MPWKKCPHCEGLSYSAATNYQSWVCPYCEKDIKHTADHQPETVPREPPQKPPE